MDDRCFVEIPGSCLEGALPDDPAERDNSCLKMVIFSARCHVLSSDFFMCQVSLPNKTQQDGRFHKLGNGGRVSKPSYYKDDDDDEVFLEDPYGNLKQLLMGK